MSVHYCSDCTFSSKWPSSLRRHFSRIHAEQKLNISEQKLNISEQKLNIPEQKLNISEQKLNISSVKQHHCDQCNKVLASNQSYKRHIAICKGNANVLECCFCKKTFSFIQARCRHQKTCMAKNTALIPVQTAPDGLHIQTQNNIHTQQNINNGYVNDTDEKQKEMQDAFRNVVKDLKLIVYDITKDV